MPPQSILVVTSSPDHRDSTAELASLVTELRRRPGVTVHVWYLRNGDAPPWTGARVVDDLRTLPLPGALEKVGLRPLAGLIRGRLLRQWWAEVQPDVIVLDDGLGQRLLPDDRAGLVVVHRINSVGPVLSAPEPRPTEAADIQLVPAEAEVPPEPSAPIVVPTTPRSDLEPARPFTDDEARAIVRKRVGVPIHGLLVVGWGEHPWFDGPDMFVRTIWNLREHQGVDAHGLWVGGDEDGEVAAVVADEAERCGLTDHITHRPTSTIDVRLCGDVVFLPYRDDGNLEFVHQAAITGCEVVTFPVWRTSTPGVRTVPHLDLAAAATSIAGAAGDDRAERAATASAKLDIAPLVDDLLDAITTARGSR